MAARMFSLSIPPAEVLHTLMGEVDGDVLHHEYYPLAKDRGFGLIVLRDFTAEAIIILYGCCILRISRGAPMQP